MKDMEAEEGRSSKLGHRGAAPGTLAARMAVLDQDRFVGRTAQLEFFERCLDGESPASVILVHGPGGIGKSTLLREVGRRALARGYDVFAVEGRELPPMPDALEAVLSGARTSERPLVVIDTYERMSALDGYLRRGLLPSLPERTVVVIAGRNPPDPGWFTGGWEGVATEMALGALDPDDALNLLDARGLGDARAPAVIEWADGSPLALALAADTAAADSEWSPAEGAERPEMVRSLIRRLAEAELQGIRLSALGVAAIARVTTLELLRAVLPDSDADLAYERLLAVSFTEPLGDGLTLHELVRKALRADLRRRDQERERELRRRIVDYLYRQARLGDPMLAIEMSHLIENSAIKWGFGWEGSVDYRIDDVQDGDADKIARILAERGFPEWWRLTRRFFTEAPERVAIARDVGDRLCGYLVCMTAATAPEFAHQDPLTGPWLVHARADGRLGESVLWHDSVDFVGDSRGRVQAMLGMAGVLRSGASNPRFAYLPINPTNPHALGFARVLGAEHLPDLDLEMGDRRVECHRIDFGPGGSIAAQRAVVYAELGLARPDDGNGEVPHELESVREALRNFRVPHELARSPLATGQTPEERAESVRTRLLDAADRAFGDNENEKLLRRVLIRGYIEPAPSHEQAAIDLSLSRAAYFRRLRAAAERVAEFLAARG
jgi:hypothetical protein